MKRINLLDLGRFIASLIVLLYHYFQNGINHGKVNSIGFTEPISSIVKYGYIGVPFFFMISGYVIYYSAFNKSAYDFLVSRMKRLYPSYWTAIIFTSVVAYFLGAGTEMAVTLKQILANFTMIQRFLGVENVDGVYWTLLYELKFYILVFLILFFSNEKVLLTFFKIWPALILLSFITGQFKFLFDHQFSYFSFGLLIAMYNINKSRTVVLPLLLSVGLSVYAINLRSESVTDYIVYSSMVITFMAFFYSLMFDSISNIKVKNSYILGALTYPMYLIHAHFGYMVLNRYATESNKLFVYAFLFASVIVLSYLIHHYIEVKMKNVWHSLFSKALLPVRYAEQIYKKRLTTAR